MMEFSFLNQLSNKSDKYKIKIRVSRMWDAVNRNNQEIISSDMILIDEQNNAIHSTIHKNISKKLKPFLKEGQLYALSNFEVGNCNEFYRPIQNEQKIIFLPTTNIQELTETEVNIPHHKFEFVDYNTIVQRLNSHVQLSDIIAKVVAIGPIEHPTIKGSKVALRNITVMTIQGDKIKLTLWGPVANEIDDNLFKRNPGPFIIVATCLIVKTFKGEYNLSSTSGTKSYINLEIPETSAFMDQDVKNDHLIEELPRQFKPQRTIEEEMNNSRRTIIEILNMVWNSENKETIFTCHGKITKIETAFGWYFMSCETCRRKVKPRGEHLWCDRCNKLAGFPIPRYRIELKVKDDTRLTTFILFDSMAEKLLHISAKELINKCSQVPEEFDMPMQIANLIGKTFVFQLELNDYNLKQGWEIYTVKKVFDPVMQIDNSVKLDQITDYYMSDATNDSDNNLPSEKDANPTNDASQVQLTPIADRQKRKRKQKLL
ncbi:uncharacterized protein LOC126706841 isoform X2 [Quercus robur]|nr:uncharacterized protein LOC126706841 isoform X2 [Quercus robur]